MGAGGWRDLPPIGSCTRLPRYPHSLVWETRPQTLADPFTLSPQGSRIMSVSPVPAGSVLPAGTGFEQLHKHLPHFVPAALQWPGSHHQAADLPCGERWKGRSSQLSSRTHALYPTPLCPIPPGAVSPSPVCRGAQDDFMDEHTMLYIREAWLSELQLSKDAEKTRSIP